MPGLTLQILLNPAVRFVRPVVMSALEWIALHEMCRIARIGMWLIPVVMHATDHLVHRPLVVLRRRNQYWFGRMVALKPPHDM